VAAIGHTDRPRRRPRRRDRDLRLARRGSVLRDHARSGPDRGERIRDPRPPSWRGLDFGSIVGAETLVLKIDGGDTQTITFLAGDTTAAKVEARINATLRAARRS
jgi:hypothetical protein